MKEIFAFIAEIKIRQAIENGELSNLPGQGESLAIDNSLALVPPEERVAFRVMKNAGLVPDEVAIMHELVALRNDAVDCPSDIEKEILSKKLREAEIRLNILMEKRRSRR